MSGESALELLGENSSVILSKNAPGEAVPGQTRKRQKIQGAVGPWYPMLDQSDLQPEIYNNWGRLGLRLKIRGNPTSERSDYYCERKDSVFICKPSSSVQLEVTLTDNCFRAISVYQRSDIEIEQAFLLKF